MSACDWIKLPTVLDSAKSAEIVYNFIFNLYDASLVDRRHRAGQIKIFPCDRSQWAKKESLSAMRDKLSSQHDPVDWVIVLSRDIDWWPCDDRSIQFKFREIGHSSPCSPLPPPSSPTCSPTCSSSRCTHLISRCLLFPLARVILR